MAEAVPRASRGEEAMGIAGGGEGEIGAEARALFVVWCFVIV